MRSGGQAERGGSAAAGWGSRTWVWSALSQVLAELRDALHFGTASVLVLPDSGPAEILGTTDPRWLPFEPVRLSVQGSSGRTVLRSQLRSFVDTVDEAIAVPLHTETGRAMLLLQAGRPELVAQVATASEEALSRSLREAARLRHHEVDQGYRIVAEAATAVADVGRVADIALAVARTLTDSDTAYVSVPVDDERFGFSRTLGVRTSGFRRLRVGPRQGLGSLAQTENVPARSVDYAADGRFCGHMHQVTGQEGIHSAMVAPILAEDRVAAVLYVANHAPLAYRSADESMLSEFASAIGLVLGAEGVREEQRELAREEERRRIARLLHDRLGRQIVQLAHLVDDMDGAAQDLRRLSASIGACADTLRQELTALDGQPEPMSPAAVVAEICRAPRVGGLRREVEIRSGPARSDYDSVIAAAAADVLQRVGQEAVFNAELHSGGTGCRITLAHQPGRWVLTVTDDGVGLRPASPDRIHLGMRWMQRAVAEVGGRLEISDSDAGAGLRVECTVPEGAPG